MKIALISDIHSNFNYLEQVMLQIERMQVNEIYCLGDIVGYYDNPNKVIELLINKKVQCIKGNHEKYLLGQIGYKVEKEEILRVNEQKNILNKNNLEFITNLPDFIKKIINGKVLYFTHSLPDDTTSYIRSKSDLDIINFNNSDYYCFGHTHIPMITYHYGVSILNPGSIGQPRDYTRMPSFIVFNPEKNICELHKVNISISSYTLRLHNLNFPKKLIDILHRRPNGKDTRQKQR